MSLGFSNSRKDTLLSCYTIDSVNITAKPEEFTDLKNCYAEIEKLREIKGALLEELQIERCLNRHLVFSFESEDEITDPKELVKIYAHHLYQNRKLKYKLLIHRLAEQQTEGMKNLKDKILNDLNTLDCVKTLKTNEEVYMLLRNHVSMVQRRMKAVAKRNEMVQSEFEIKLAKLKHANRKTLKLEGKYLTPVYLAQSKLKNGENLSDEETLQVLYAKWKKINTDLKRILKKMHHYYINMRKSLNLHNAYLFNLVIEDEKCTKKITEHKKGAMYMEIIGSPVFSDTDIIDVTNCYPHALAQIGKNALEVTKDHFKLESLRSKIKKIRRVSAGSFDTFKKRELIDQSSFG